MLNVKIGDTVRVTHHVYGELVKDECGNHLPCKPPLIIVDEGEVYAVRKELPSGPSFTVAYCRNKNTGYFQFYLDNLDGNPSVEIIGRKVNNE